MLKNILGIAGLLLIPALSAMDCDIQQSVYSSYQEMAVPPPALNIGKPIPQTTEEYVLAINVRADLLTRVQEGYDIQESVTEAQKLGTVVGSTRLKQFLSGTRTFSKERLQILAVMARSLEMKYYNPSLYSESRLAMIAAHKAGLSVVTIAAKAKVKASTVRKAMGPENIARRMDADSVERLNAQEKWFSQERDRLTNHRGFTQSGSRDLLTSLFGHERTRLIDAYAREHNMSSEHAVSDLEHHIEEELRWILCTHETQRISHKDQ